MDVFPQKSSLDKLDYFPSEINAIGISAIEILEELNNFGAPNTIAQIGGRYFGFVNGGVIPASMAAKWLADTWDQCESKQ